MKKLFTLLSATMLLGFTASAQYYMTPFMCTPGMNPNGVNKQTENPESGWTNIATTSATPIWSSTVTMPFTFLFNGSAVTQYKASTSGVVTFTTSASTVPSSTNATIPDASIPDKSVMVWGIAGTGANDVIRQQTFGTAPYRQHWVQYYSYSAPGSPGGDWSYWGIVFEETTNKIFIVDQRTYLTPLSLTLGIQINSTTAMSVAGAPNTPSLVTNGGSVADPSDNIYYEYTFGSNPAFDVKSSDLTIAPYLSLTNAPFSIKGSSRNMGTTTITSMDVNYSINGGTPVTATLSSLNISNGGCYNFTHPTNWNPGSAGTYTIRAWMSKLNGSNADAAAWNDTAKATVFVAAVLAQRQDLFERLTSSTCGPCATYGPAFKTLLDGNGCNTSSGKVNLIDYQQNFPTPGTDPCFNTESGARETFYGGPGIPFCAMDGNQYQGHIANMTQGIIDAEYARAALFDMSGLTTTYNGTTVTIGGSIKCLVPLAAGCVLQLVVVENHINQNDGGHGTQTNGEIDWYYVMRKMIPSNAGTALGTLTTGQTVPVNQTYNFTGVPKIYTSLGLSSVIAFVQDGTTKEVHQSIAKPLVLTGINNQNSPLNMFSIYPNPASDNANIAFELKQAENVKVTVTNMLGAVVYSVDKGNMSQGQHIMTIDASAFSSGMYFVTFTAGSKIITEKMSIEK